MLHNNDNNDYNDNNDNICNLRAKESCTVPRTSDDFDQGSEGDTYSGFPQGELLKNIWKLYWAMGQKMWLWWRRRWHWSKWKSISWEGRVAIVFSEKDDKEHCAFDDDDIGGVLDDDDDCAIEKHPNDEDDDVNDDHAIEKHPNDEERAVEERGREDLSSRCPSIDELAFSKSPPPSSSPPPHHRQALSQICREFFRWPPSSMFVQLGCSDFDPPIAQCRLVWRGTDWAASS